MTSEKAPPENLQPPFSRPEPEILRRVWDRLNRRNEHFMCAIVGEEGSGKSFTALRLAREIDPEFGVEDVIFEAGELLRRLRDEDYRQGQAIVLDEAGVSLGRRTWQQSDQIKVNQALQLIRSHNLACFFTLPRLGGLDSQTVARLQAFLEITKKVPDEYAVGKWKYIDPDRADQTGTTYHKYPKLSISPDKPKRRVTSVAFAPPSGDYVDDYLERKSKHQKEVYDEALGELEDDTSEEAEQESMGPKEIAQEIADSSIEPYTSTNGSTGQPYINKDLIRVSYDLSHSDASAVKSLLEKVFDPDDLEDASPTHT